MTLKECNHPLINSNWNLPLEVRPNPAPRWSRSRNTKQQIPPRAEFSTKPRCCNTSELSAQPAVPLSFLKSSASCLSVTISFMLTTLRWMSCRRILISRMAVMGNPSFSLSRRTFFRATSSPAGHSRGTACSAALPASWGAALSGQNAHQGTAEVALVTSLLILMRFLC